MVCSPYERTTFRYTPLLPLLLSSTVIHPLLGRLTLVCISLLVTPLLLASGASFWPTHLLWTLNPFVLNITTRGSPESIIVILVVMLLLCIRNSNQAPHLNERVVWETFAAVTLAMAISWKIYPVIYIPAIWAVLASRYGWLGGDVWWFGTVTLASLLIINVPLWAMYVSHLQSYDRANQSDGDNLSWIIRSYITSLDWIIDTTFHHTFTQFTTHSFPHQRDHISMPIHFWPRLSITP
jgi:hypothetical protein